MVFRPDTSRRLPAASGLAHSGCAGCWRCHGHVAAGCVVRTTAEVLLQLLPGWDFAREPDAATGFDELVVRPR